VHVIAWSVSLALGLIAAWLAYGRTARDQRLRALLPAACRAAAIALVAALVFGAPSAPPRPLAPLVAFDVSASWRRAAGDDSASARALRSFAGQIAKGSDQTILVGDSVRDVGASDFERVLPSDGASRIRPAVDRAAALGRPLTLITDGEVDDADAMEEAPPGSVVRIPTRAAKRDVALAEVSLPPSATAGDTVQLAMVLVAGAAGGTDGAVNITLDGVAVGTAPIASLSAFASTRVTVPIVVPRGARLALVRAAVQVAGDVEPRNDTLAVALEIADRPPAVFVSTAPDLDVREALVVLRGGLQIPTRAYLRLAPSVWREEGSLKPISEADVKARASNAGLLIVHGDTSWGTTSGNAVRTAQRGARALWVPAQPTAAARAGETARAAEWYVTSAPSSPLAAALAGLPWDSLPPLTLGTPAKGQFTVIEAKLGKSGDAAAAIAGREDAGARTLIVSGSGYSGWSLRGGRSAEAFTALWGAIFDWLAAGRGDVRAARPAASFVRASEPVRWRRGGADSVVNVVLRARGASTNSRADTVRLLFAGAAFETLGPAMLPGVYDVQGPGGASLLVVNSSREWVPRAPTLRDGTRSKGVLGSDAPRLVDHWWPFVAALLLLCAEWIGRRLMGLR